MTRKSTTRKCPNKEDAAPKPKVCKPPKPRPDFPLCSHVQGRWMKKIRGKIHFFGRWGRKP